MKKYIISIFFFLLLFITSNCNFKRFKEKEYLAKINEINDIEISLVLNDINIKINLENNEISATNNKNIFFLNCEETNFNI